MDIDTELEAKQPVPWNLSMKPFDLNYSDDYKVRFQCNTPYPYFWLDNTLEDCLHIHDAELDDLGLCKAMTNSSSRPAVSIILTFPKKDHETLGAKLKLMQIWLDRDAELGTVANFVLPASEVAISAKRITQLVRDHCVHGGRIRICSTAPSGCILKLLLDDPELGKLPWDLVCYSGAYNVSSGEPKLLDLVARKMNSGDGSRMFNANWFTAMGADKMPPELKNFGTILQDEDWDVLPEPLEKAIRHFLKLFNRKIADPDDLFLDTANPEIVKAARDIWQQDKLDDYLKYCNQNPSAVKPKKRGLLSKIDQDAPGADFLIALALQRRLWSTGLWKVVPGKLVVDEKLQVFQVAEGVAPNNVFGIQLTQLHTSEALSPIGEIHSALVELLCD